jgi:hypothetical protein
MGCRPSTDLGPLSPFLVDWRVARLYRMFHSKHTLTIVVFVTFGDINITRQTSFFFLVVIKKKLQNSFTADVHHLLEDINTSCALKLFYQSVYCIILYFLVRIRTAKCFTNSNKLF